MATANQNWNSMISALQNYVKIKWLNNPAIRYLSCPLKNSVSVMENYLQ